MEEPKSSEDIFLDLLREETGEPSLSFEHAMEMPLAGTFLRTIRRESKADQESANLAVPLPSAPPKLTFSDPSLLFRTAIQDTFDASELDLTDTERADLVAGSDLVMIGGKRRLRLSDARRAEILDAEMGVDFNKTILERSVVDDLGQYQEIERDPVRLPTAWLRRFLSGKSADIDSAPPAELKAALAARDRLRLVRDLPSNVPSIDDLVRRVELAELLEPLRLLIGAEGGWDGSPRRDRFVGREDELKRLRAFVDELSSKGYAEAASRFVANVRHSLTGDKPTLMVIEARGGLGKSTLLAKFVLDHALGQERPFPFAYLDFDRASLDPQRPRQLLIEIARQVALQFPEARPELSRLSESIRAEFAGATPSTAMGSTIQDPFAAFVEIVREHATFGERAFLLVLDTLEVVQWDSSAINKLASLLYEFRVKGLDELKVVASGRADVPELRRASGSASIKNMELPSLRVQEAMKLADALGQTAIGDEWQPTWSGVIAGREKDLVRREPLAVRVAVDLIARAQPEERQTLADEISSSGIEAHDDFVARIYFKRVVNHVRDPLARKLAWPGLVVRRVTVELIRELLAPLCDISADQAEAAFDALGQEVWIVNRDGNALKHRQDLRARTLPLMRKEKTEKFEEIALKAVAYFEKYLTRSPEDHAEWIYHRLLIGEPPETVAPDLPDDFLPLLGRAAEDFPVDSPTASYLASRTSKSRLSPSRIRALRPDDALYHLSRTSVNTFALDDVSFDSVAQNTSKRISRGKGPTPSLESWAMALWIKTGRWEIVAAGPNRLDLSNIPLLRARLFWAARIAPTLPNKDREQLVEECIRVCSEKLEGIGIRVGIQLLAMTRIVRSESFIDLDRRIADILARTKPNPAPSTQSALRTAIVLGEASRVPALELWLNSRRRGSGDRVQTPSISLAEVKALTRLDPESGSYFSQLIKEADDAPARFTDSYAVSTADSVLEGMIPLPGRQASGEIVDQKTDDRFSALAQLFACRDEDWIVPMAYAMERASEASLSRTISRYLRFYDRCNREKPSEAVGRDFVVNLRSADEAGDLSGFVNLMLTECDPEAPATKEVQFLLRCRNAWQVAIGKVIGSHEQSRIPSTPSSGVFSATVTKIRNAIGIGGDRAESDSDVAQRGMPSKRPPKPGPILNVDDPQRGRWGGESARDGRQGRVVLESVERDIFYFSVVVESTDWTPLETPVVFHLHDTFPRSVVTIRRIENQQAILREWSAYGVFAIGVQVKNAAGEWIPLEIDLANTTGLPKRFLAR